MVGLRSRAWHLLLESGRKNSRLNTLNPESSATPPLSVGFQVGIVLLPLLIYQEVWGLQIICPILGFFHPGATELFCIWVVLVLLKNDSFLKLKYVNYYQRKM